MIYNFFFEILLKEIANLLFWELWECLTNPTKIIASISSKLSYFSACKKSTSPLTSFLRYCKEIANLLFWVIWGWLATHTENDSISFRKPFTFICGQKINFILHVFLYMFQRYYCKLAVFNILGMPGYAHPKW